MPVVPKHQGPVDQRTIQGLIGLNFVSIVQLENRNIFSQSAT